MIMHENAVTFAKEVEKDARIKELARKNDSAEGLTSIELDEFIRLIDRATCRFGRV